MASKHTPNYGLSQWEATDKVLREDFNVDNAAIDEALFRADRRGLQVIKEIVTTEDTNDLTVTFPEIDWKEWNTVRVIIYSTPQTTFDIDCYVHYTDVPLGVLRVHGTQIIFIPSGRDDISIMGMFLGVDSVLFNRAASILKDFKQFRLKAGSSTGKMGAGTRIVFLGEHV